MIAFGRVLTGRMPEDVTEQDFHAYTCSISTFQRMDSGQGMTEEVKLWKEGLGVPDVGWRGKGIHGGWKCMGNAETAHLSGGGERGW